jgi:threonine dehydrogenase-like Zn-dependent dehydrogenase
MERMYGARTAGLFGYSHLTGGFSGGQSEFVRVPFADVNLLEVPAGMSGEAAVLLADVAPTAWHGTELGRVGADDAHRRVAVWGAGPVGLLTVLWAKLRGATKVVCIDRWPARLALAHALGADETINYSEVKDVPGRLREIFAAEKEGEAPLPGGVDVAIDCVGFRYSKSLESKLESAVVQTDSVDVIDEAVLSLRKAGTLVLIGDYIGTANHFPIGAVMEKGLEVRGGQSWPQRYWPALLNLLQSKEHP